MNVTNSLFEDLAQSEGAGAMLIGQAGETLLSNNVFRRNSARQGGALIIAGTTRVVLEDCHFINNTAVRDDPSVPIPAIKG